MQPLPLPVGAAMPGTGGTVNLPPPIVIKEVPPLQNPPVFSPVVIRETEYCFGALGAECGGAQFNIPILALCGLGHCSINGGSWRHDECCAAHPAGMACRYGPADQLTGHDGNCVSEWNRALGGISYAWGRGVDFSKPNATGLVNFADYCAQSGSRLHKDDVAFCCSGQAHVEQIASKLADANVRICN